MANCMTHTTAITMRQSNAFLADTYTTHPDITLKYSYFPHLILPHRSLSHLEELEGYNLLDDLDLTSNCETSSTFNCNLMQEIGRHRS